MASTLDPIAPPRTCPACSSDRLGSAPIARFRGCVDCGHVWAPPTEVDNTMFEAEDYVEWRTASGAQQRRQARIAADRLRWVAGSLPASGRSLELGCSTGEVVQALAERSWEAYGVDLSAAAVAAGAARHPRARLAVGTGPTDAGFPADGYDLLCAFHVVEHLPDLDAFAGLARSALVPRGLLYLRLPNWDSWSRRALGSHWPDLVPEHLHHFSPSSMTRWLDANGFEVVRLATRGDAREWVGGLRRRLTRTDTSAGACRPLGPRAHVALGVSQRVGRPWFRLEERYDRGSELLVAARLR
jgi:SAM-dependent methyltransferase